MKYKIYFKNSCKERIGGGWGCQRDGGVFETDVKNSKGGECQCMRREKGKEKKRAIESSMKWRRSGVVEVLSPGK